MNTQILKYMNTTKVYVSTQNYEEPLSCHAHNLKVLQYEKTQI